VLAVALLSVVTNPESLAKTEIREFTLEDDLDGLSDLARRAFGPGPAGTVSEQQRAERQAELESSIREHRIFGAFAGHRVVASARYHDMRQWWHGMPAQMAGVAAVMVAPEYRSQGVGRALMTAVLEAIAARGYPLSALYPATMPLYRSLGWELAGGMHLAVIPARSLRALAPTDVTGESPAVSLRSAELRRAAPGDAEEVLSVVGRAHELARDCGPLTWDAGTVARWLADPDLYAYLADDGFLAYRWHRGNDEILVERAVAASAQTTRAMWSIVASHSSIAETVRARVGPADPFWWLTRERDANLGYRDMWMLRVVDAPAAIAARGFPVSAELSARLWIDDTARAGNSGLWELSVAGGKGGMAPCREADAPLALGARGLAALYAGTPVGVLRLAGLAAGGTPEADGALDGAFAASAFMLDSF
jgi:predicted acetyltransferase